MGDSQACLAPWQLCTRTWKPRMCSDFTVYHFNPDTLNPGRFISFPDEVRLPNTTRIIDIMLSRRPGQPASRFPAWGKFVNKDGRADPDKSTTLKLDLIRADDAEFERDILPEASVNDWFQNGLAQDPPNGLGLDVKSIATETNCRARQINILTVSWTTPTDLDAKGIYQFRMRTLDLETRSEPFRLQDTPEGLDRIKELQGKGLALASDSRDRAQHSFIWLAVLALGIVVLAWAAAYVFKAKRRKRAADRRAKAVDLGPSNIGAVYVDEEES